MTIRPPRRVRARETLVPSARRRSSSTRSSVRIRRRRGCRRRLGRRLPEPPDQLLGLADRESLADDDLERRDLGLGREAAERPGVALGDRPSARAAWTAGSRSSRRSVLATVERARPTRVGDRSPGCSRTRRSAAGRRRPPRAGRGPRAGCSRRARARAGRWSASWRTTAGIRSRPASVAARTRRSPATSW